MDWLRIGAFALLILYHIGMVFVPWGFHVKTAHPLVWVEIPMFLTNPWRLTLLFVVSGYASRALLARSGSVAGFLRSRTARLIVPLLFGMAVIVPPQVWVDLRFQHGYTRDFVAFWTRDYFRFGVLSEILMPSWNHLWFLLYLWLYTLGLAVLLLVPGLGGGAQRVFDTVFARWRALLIPALYFVLLEAVLFDDHYTDTHDVVTDGVAHLRYVPAFLFGFGLARSRGVLDGLVAWRHVSAALAIGCFATIAILLLLYPDFSFPGWNVIHLYLGARYLEAWTAIAALIGYAERHWNCDAPGRAMLAEATFPFYLIHQTAIIVFEYALLPYQLGALAEFLILVPATVAACWAFYLVGRRIAWLRPLIGLRRLSPMRASARIVSHDAMDLDDTRRRGIDDPRPSAA